MSNVDSPGSDPAANGACVGPISQAPSATAPTTSQSQSAQMPDGQACQERTSPSGQCTVRTSPGRLVLDLPGGLLPMRLIVALAVGVLGVTLCIVVALSILSIANPGKVGAELWLICLPVLGIGLLGPLLLLREASRGRVCRTYVLIEPPRLVVESSFFGRKHIQHHVLDSESRAFVRRVGLPCNLLTVANPLTVVTDNGVAVLSSNLKLEDARWLAQWIDALLDESLKHRGVAPPPFPPGGEFHCELCGDQLTIELPPACSKRLWTLSAGAAGMVALPVILFITKDTPNRGVTWPTDWFPVLFGVCWSAAVVLGCLAICDKLRKTWVTVELYRLTVHRRLFGRTRTRQYTLDENSRAELVLKGGRKGENAEYAIKVTTVARPASFGHALSESDQKSAIEQINRHLHEMTAAGKVAAGAQWLAE